jgi:hypothetical protein
VLSFFPLAVAALSIFPITAAAYAHHQQGFLFKISLSLS